MTSADDERPEPCDPNLIPAELHLWICRGLLETEVEKVIWALSEEEQERTGKLRFERDRRRFAGSRYLLRRVLGRHLECEPRDFSFAYGKWGKPEVENGGISFNLSRSNDVAVLAVGKTGEIGIDVEWSDPMRADRTVVHRQFSDPEQAYVNAADDPAKAFFEIWTGKEAYIKALGRGLSHPLGKFNVAPVDGEEVWEVDDWSENAPERPLSLMNLALPGHPDYHAALAGRFSWETIKLHSLPLAELLP